MVRRATVAVVAGVAVSFMTVAAQAPAPPLEWFFQAVSPDDKIARPALDRLSAVWKDSYTSMIVDLARFLPPAPRPGEIENPLEQPRRPDDPDESAGAIRPTEPSFGPASTVTRQSLTRSRLISFLERQTKKRFDQDLNGWRDWMWTLPYEPHPDSTRFKGSVYAKIDPRMSRFFPIGARSLIRLDEIDWGGVTVNGIPPLVYPKVITGQDATYLRNGHIVFGLVVNGEARAYPKRILGWHEMAIDRLGGVELTVVYCTLCGTVIPYESVAGGRLRRFGTSGLLYRSNKLMFDEETGSLWSTLEGRPVVGALVDAGLQLVAHPAVTTTWGEWRAEHPETTVLSLDTGHKRDYAEGAAYRDYFGSDELYFRVSKTDRKLKNKAEVLALHVRASAGVDRQPVAIVADFLKRTPVYHFAVLGRRMVVVTTREGANRVYDLSGETAVFQARAVDGSLTDEQGRRWRISEPALILDAASAAAPRVVAHRAFWFGWYAQFPDTILLGR